MTASPVPLYIKSFQFIIKVFLFLLAIIFSCDAFANAQADTLPQIMESRMVELQDTGTLVIAGNRIAAHRLLPELYGRRQYTLAWDDDSKREELIGILRHIDEEGLNPEDYLLSSLLDYQARAQQLTDAERVDFDILLTESLVRLGYHLRFGKVDPKSLDPNWNLTRSLENRDPATIIQAAIDSNSIQSFINKEIPRQDFYVRFKAALADYRNIKQEGGWPQVPPGPALKPGMHDPRISLLKQRLQIEGYLDAPEASTRPEYYDAAVSSNGMAWVWMAWSANRRSMN